MLPGIRFVRFQRTAWKFFRAKSEIYPLVSFSNGDICAYETAISTPVLATMWAIAALILPAFIVFVLKCAPSLPNNIELAEQNRQHMELQQRPQYHPATVGSNLSASRLGNYSAPDDDHHAHADSTSVHHDGAEYQYDPSANPPSFKVNYKPPKIRVAHVDHPVMWRESRCAICLTLPLTVACSPCGHMFCSECSVNITRCGICRSIINKRIVLQRVSDDSDI